MSRSVQINYIDNDDAKNALGFLKLPDIPLPRENQVAWWSRFQWNSGTNGRSILWKDKQPYNMYLCEDSVLMKSQRELNVQINTRGIRTNDYWATDRDETMMFCSYSTKFAHGLQTLSRNSKTPTKGIPS